MMTEQQIKQAILECGLKYMAQVHKEDKEMVAFDVEQNKLNAKRVEYLLQFIDESVK